MITIYTDGASRGNPGRGGWGAVVASDTEVREIGGSDVHTTNNKMELTAAIKALELVPKGARATIYTDSEYVMKGMTQWIGNWQKKDWKTAAKKPVENKLLWLMLLDASLQKEVEWKYVAGHSGHAANDRVDEIATSFADGVATPLYIGSREHYRTSLK